MHFDTGKPSRWLVPGQDMPDSSAARFAPHVSDPSASEPDAPPEADAPATSESPTTPPDTVPKSANTPPTHPKTQHKHAPRPATPAEEAPAARQKSGQKARVSRRAFAKTHMPRMHRTGPQPKLAPYLTDIRKLMKKGYAPADIYHWLHDMRHEDISQRSVQRFVREIQGLRDKKK